MRHKILKSTFLASIILFMCHYLFAQIPNNEVFDLKTDTIQITNTTNFDRSLGVSCSFGNQYAVIINGGENSTSNFIWYWNNCAKIYSTLINKYHFDKSKIYVIISDGTDPAVDMNPGKFYPLISSPLDLDGDGIDDTQYAATKSNIAHVFDTLFTLITNEDNVFIFVTDHGLPGEIYLWDNVIMTDVEFAAEVDKVNAAKSINIVMAQCFSGSFIPILSGNNRVITTACKANELSSERIPAKDYDEFVYHWVSAIDGETPEGTVVNADYNGDGIITMDEAYLYAFTAVQNIHSYQTPQFSGGDFGNSLSLSSDYCPSIFLWLTIQQ